MNLSPVFLLLTTLAMGFGLKALVLRSETVEKARIQQVVELERKNDQLQSFLVHKEKEREQMIKLADARSEELWLELDSRDQELAKLWKLVGKKASAKPARKEEGRKALMGSRGGSMSSTLEVKRRYQRLMTTIQSNEKEMANLGVAAKAYRENRVRQYRERLSSRTPSLWPCTGDLSSGYGSRIHPVYGVGRFHSGCDISAPMGTEIRAAAAGTVSTSGWLGGYGQAIEIDHGSGLSTLYGHCSQLVVPVGTQVIKGQLVARVGSTGVSTGPHLHYEVKINGSTIDPAPYLKEKEAPRPVANL